jgi:GR25 family glycosyltransferase involved in LPS biosynthesis
MRLHNINFEFFNAVSKSYLNPLTQMVMPEDPLLSGSPNKSGLMGCLLSHLNIMKIALSRGQKQILIFEDDVTFHKDAHLLFQNFISECNKNSINIKEIDCIHFGYVPVIKKGDYDVNDVWSYRYLQHISESGTLLKSKHFLCTHAYAISEKFMKAYIDLYANYPINTEWLTNDWAIRNFFLENEDFKCYSPCPQICAVKPCVSDNSGLTEDKIEERLTNTNYTYFDDYE